MFQRDERAAKHLRDATESLPSAKETPLWDWEGNDIRKVQSQVDARTKKNPKLLPIVSRCVAYGNTPIIVHGYKFEDDPFMKLELLLPSNEARQPEFALKSLSTALECHEYLIPDCIATPLSPFTGHESDFETLTEHLTRTLPADLYDLCISSTPEKSRPR